MKRSLLLTLLTTIFFSCAPLDKPSEGSDTQTTWTGEKRLQHLENTEDASTWDTELLEGDKQMAGFEDFGPFVLGAFPVPHYDLLGKGSFRGVGNKAAEFEVGPKNVMMNSFFVRNSELNSSRLNGREDEVFFQIITLTDISENESGEAAQSVVLSRNHPDYLGQGFFKTSNNKIDYVAFLTAENHSYAIVNTKLFDLNFGTTILVAPRKDRTFRTLQIDSPKLTSLSVGEYTSKLLKQAEVMEFFTAEENI